MVTQRNNNFDRKMIPMENDPQELLTSLLQEIYWKQHQHQHQQHPPSAGESSWPDPVPPPPPVPTTTSDGSVVVGVVGLPKKFKCKTIGSVHSCNRNKVCDQVENGQELRDKISMLTRQIHDVNHLLLRLLKQRDKHLRQQRCQYRYLDGFLPEIIHQQQLQHQKPQQQQQRHQRIRYSNTKLSPASRSSSSSSASSSYTDWTPKIIANTIRYMIGGRFPSERPEYNNNNNNKENMSLINKKLKQIGRRFSVNDGSMSHDSTSGNKTRRFSSQIRYKLAAATATAANNDNDNNDKNQSSSTSAIGPINDGGGGGGECLVQANLEVGLENNNDDVVGGGGDVLVDSGVGGGGDGDDALDSALDSALDDNNDNDDDDDDDESGFEQWHNAMRMVARLPGGIPGTFRKKLWLTLADCYIKQQRKIMDWNETLEHCFNDSKNPDDEQLGWQIVKDLHRTGCSLFDGDQQNNQLLLKQLLLAYARFNKSIGYCQGFNMLAAIILEVMEGDVGHSLKIMIYLIEHLLPDGYFSNNLRGLSVDMVVFRDLMHLKLPRLAKHLDQLQQDSYDPQLGIFYEPPLINAFTMQWFLTLFANCLPKQTVLRIWDLIFLEGNEILLRSAIVIWDSLSDRIIAVKSADEFYSIMNVLTREIMEFGLKDSNELIMAICNVATFPFPRLMELRDNYYYNCSPFNVNILHCTKNNGLVQLFNNSLQKLFDDDHVEQQPQSSQSRSPQTGDIGDRDDDPKNRDHSTQNWFEDQILMINWFMNQNNNNNQNNQNNQQNQLNKARSPNRSPIRSIYSITSSGNSGGSGGSGGGSNFFETFLKQIQIGQNNSQSSSSSSNGGGGGKSGGLAPDSMTAQNQWPNVGSMDISMLKKQYLKLKQRQRQVQIILKEGFQNIDPGRMVNSKEQRGGGVSSGDHGDGAGISGADNRKEKEASRALISKLLSGKAPLMVKRRGRIESTIKQSISRAKFVANRSESLMVAANIYPRIPGIKTTTKMMEIGSKIKQTTTRTTMMDGKPTFDVVALQPSTMNIMDHHAPDSSRPRSEISIKRTLKRSNSSSGGSSSYGGSSGSTSTELCDEILGISSEDYKEEDEDFRTGQTDEAGEDSAGRILRLAAPQPPPQPPPPPPPPSSSSSSGSLSRSLNDLHVLDNVVLVRKVRMQMDIVERNDRDGICDEEGVFNNTDGDGEDGDGGGGASTMATSQLDETIKKFQEKISQVKIE